MNRIIEKGQLLNLFLEACPSFYGAYDEECLDFTGQIAENLSCHILDLYQQNTTEELPIISSLIEKIYICAESDIKNIITISILSKIYIALNKNNIDLNFFKSILLPVSIAYWNSLIKFYSRDISYIGADLGQPIYKEQFLDLILIYCPSFHIISDRYDYEYKTLYYSIAGDLAHHLLWLYQNNNLEEFPAVGQLIEELHLHGDNYVQTLATIGILEDIQNVWANKKVNPEKFEIYLLSVSLKYWHSLNKFWDGEVLCVGSDVRT